jgi:hypothetical protein
MRKAILENSEKDLELGMAELALNVLTATVKFPGVVPNGCASIKA